MTLTAGTRLGPYEVIAPIGVGGMGEVFRARDTKLNREVALKVLPEAVAADVDRLARFRREAQLLASLSHPHIASIFGLEETNDFQALVLELVEGPTLRDRIASGPLPVDEALPVARQIAEALEAAHEQGIVHRDLKPENIKLRLDGTVKVLDFGIAKAREAAIAAGTTQAATVAAPMTEIGLVLGTAGYMSPEQARGLPVDKRADIWAFGCVLYEILTGKQAFPMGGAGPDWRLLPRELPAGVRALLARCLERDARRRLRDIGEARIALDDAISGVDAAPPHPATAPRKLSLALAAGIAALGALVGGFVVGWSMRVDAPPPTRLAIVPPADQPLTGQSLAISPDGRQVVYVSGNGTQLSVRSMDDPNPLHIPDLGLPSQPFISPDGRWIGFFDGLTALKKVPITGGPAIVLASLGGSAGRGASWGSDGYIVFATDDPATGLWRVHEDGGEPELLTRREQGDHTWPHVLPGAGAVLFSDYAYPGEDVNVAVLDLESRAQKTLLPGSHPLYSPTGHLLYGASGSLRAIGFDVDRLATVGISVPVLDDFAASRDGNTPIGLAQDGTLAYVSGATEDLADASRELVWVDRDGREEALGAPPDAYAIARLSPDGTKVALDQRARAGDGLTLWDIGRNTRSRFSFGVDAYPVWSPDGSHVAFTSFDPSTGIGRLVWRSESGGTPEVLAEGSRSRYATSFSPDGAYLLFREEAGSAGLDIGVVTIAERRSEPLIATPFSELNPELSPDGRWLAYQSDETGRPEIYVRPFPDVDAGLWQVSESGGTQPAWARDGRQLFYRIADGSLMAVDVEEGPAFLAGAPRKVLDAGYYPGGPFRSYDVSVDGERFLMITRGSAGERSPIIVVVQNWFTELERITAGD